MKTCPNIFTQEVFLFYPKLFHDKSNTLDINNILKFKTIN